MTTITHALEQLEVVEANVERARRILRELDETLPVEISFSFNERYEQKKHQFGEILSALPMIDGWKPISVPVDLDRIMSLRFDAAEISEPEILITLSQEMAEPARGLVEYMSRLRTKRREILRRALARQTVEVDNLIGQLRVLLTGSDFSRRKVESPLWQSLGNAASELATLLGSATDAIQLWPDFLRHIRFGYLVDLKDILERDWPAIKPQLSRAFVGDDEPLPVAIADIAELAIGPPSGPVPTQLNWGALSDESFERLVFALLAGDKSYKNTKWLMKTRAPDQGRDISTLRVTEDGLAGMITRRVIVQCKHWQERSVSVGDLALLKEQVPLWEPPRVDVLIIATSGRFSSDVVRAIEQHNQGDHALNVEMWPGSHLELVCAGRPALIGEFGLR